MDDRNNTGWSKSLCTWWLQYGKLQVMFKVSPASLQTFIDTPNCVLEDSVQYSTVRIPNVFSDGHLQLINCVLYCHRQVHRDFWLLCNNNSNNNNNLLLVSSSSSSAGIARLFRCRNCGVPIAVNRVPVFSHTTCTAVQTYQRFEETAASIIRLV
jgi:hypothetical protein